MPTVFRTFCGGTFPSSPWRGWALSVQEAVVLQGRTPAFFLVGGVRGSGGGGRGGGAGGRVAVEEYGTV